MALAAVAALAVCVAAAMDAFLGAGDALAADVHAIFGHVPPPRDGGLDIMHVCGAYSDLIRGQQIGFLLILLGGVPCALIGAALERARPGARWSGEWSAWVHAGLVFQMCSLVLTLFVFLIATATAALLEPSALMSPLAAVPLLIVACDIRGLRAWRALQCDSPAILLRLSP